MASRFKVGDRVIASFEIDEGEEVEPGELGTVTEVRDENYTSYPYTVEWDSLYRSDMISKREIGRIPFDLSEYVKKSEVFRVLCIDGPFDPDGGGVAQCLAQIGISPPKKRFRVSYEVEASEAPKEAFPLDAPKVDNFKVEEI